ncbi:hypothetical protein TNCV_3638101 [Trichonephila clavipes]|nr:hypothetical protein TNCV_3638101 [Trichonephila clavipes]
MTLQVDSQDTFRSGSLLNERNGPTKFLAYIQASYRDITSETTEFMRYCGNWSHSFRKRCFQALDGSPRRVASCNCLSRASHVCSIAVICKPRSTDGYRSLDQMVCRAA